MPYAENLQAVMLIFATTIFIMSWDYVPPVVRFIMRGSK